MSSLTNQEIELHNVHKFCHVWKKMFHDVDYRNDDSDDDIDDDSDGDKFDARMFYGDASELDDIDEEYYNHYHDGSDDIKDEFDATKFVALLQKLMM